MTIDIKSCIIGVLLTTTVFLTVAATKALSPGKYNVSITSRDEDLYVVIANTESGKFAIFYPDSGKGWHLHSAGVETIPNELQ